jgi:hypothetical protein
VSKGVQGHRAASGRVTPSKFRRGAVLAVDGALVIGTGAVGGLMATGSASAAAPTAGWTGTQTPLPTGPNAPGTNPSVNLLTTSCVSAVFCVDGGYYRDSSNQHPLLDVKSGGSWRSVEAPLPGNADTTRTSEVDGISCPSNGMCVASGFYKDTGGRPHGFIDTLSAGTWSTMEAPLPPDAKPAGSTFGSYLKSVDCQSNQSCVAVGNYKGTTGGGGQFGLIETYSGGVWSPQPAPQPGDAGSNQGVTFNDVSCPSMGPCSGIGNYPNGSNRQQGIVFSQGLGGAWSAQAAPLPPGSNSGASEFSQLAAVSCAGAVCAGVGSVADTSGRSHGLIEQLSGGSATPSMAPQPNNAATGSNQTAALKAVSCTFDGICNAVGNYIDQANLVTRPLIDTVNGMVITATEGPQPNDAATGSNMGAQLYAVSCLSGGECAADGIYNDNSNSGNGVGLIDQLSGGSWSAVTGPLPGNAGSGSSRASYLDAIDCSARSACEAVGDFQDGSGNQFGLADTYTPPEGYWSDASDGGIFTYGNAVFHGSMGGQHLNAPMVGMAETPGPGGYWEVGSDGGIFSFGNASFHGSTGSLVLNKPVVGMAATPTGLGYWLVASDGGIFNYGDAGFYGSTGSIHLNKPIVGMAATPDGHGYWLVASDGGVFNYGDAGFFGSRGGQPLNKPVVGMASDATGLGYWLVASDGGIFNYGDAGFMGSAGSIPLNKPIVGMMGSFDGGGYWLVASDGGIFNYGDAGFYGSAGSLHLNAPVVGGTPT